MFPVLRDENSVQNPHFAEDVEAAKAVCAGCPVRAECLEFATRTNERFGVWGGLSEKERRRAKWAAQKGKQRARAGHGTATRYSTGCRCDPCREAKRRYIRSRRANGAA